MLIISNNFLLIYYLIHDMNCVSCGGLMSIKMQRNNVLNGFTLKKWTYFISAFVMQGAQLLLLGIISVVITVSECMQANIIYIVNLNFLTYSRILYIREMMKTFNIFFPLLNNVCI